MPDRLQMEGQKHEATGREKGRRRREGEKGGENYTKRKVARLHFIFFALLLDVKSCPGLLP